AATPSHARRKHLLRRTLEVTRPDALAPIRTGLAVPRTRRRTRLEAAPTADNGHEEFDQRRAVLRGVGRTRILLRHCRFSALPVHAGAMAPHGVRSHRSPRADILIADDPARPTQRSSTDPPPPRGCTSPPPAYTGRRSTTRHPFPGDRARLRP